MRPQPPCIKYNDCIVYMHEMQLSAVDMNLLVVLGALLETGSVKGAASRLGLSPSATSHALSRLRDLLDDPILVRAGQRMVPSARAQELQPRLFRLLSDVVELLGSAGGFDPATARRSFRVSAVDYVDTVLLEPLSLRIDREAPGIDLFSVATGEGVARLRSESIDLAIGVYASLPPDIALQPLVTDHMVCVMRKGHRLSRGRLTLERWIEAPHVLTAPQGGTRAIVDTLLEQQGRRRRVARTVTTFRAAARRLVDTDFVLTMPERPARLVADELGLTIRKVPLPIEPFTISLAWHRRHDADPAHRWLRSQLADIAEGV